MTINPWNPLSLPGSINIIGPVSFSLPGMQKIKILDRDPSRLFVLACPRTAIANIFLGITSEADEKCMITSLGMGFLDLNSAKYPGLTQSDLYLGSDAAVDVDVYYGQIIT